MIRYKINNLAEDLEKKLKTYEENFSHNKPYIFLSQKCIDLLNILLSISSDNINTKIDNFNKNYIKDDYHTLYLKNKKIIFPANNINGLASELFDSLFNKNKENSFKKFQKILTSQIRGDDQKEHWFEMTFKNDEIKNYFLDKATEYIINNQTTQKQIIENLKSIDFQNDYRFSSVVLINIENTPKKFSNLFKLYKWFTIEKANNYLHYFGSNFTKSLLHEIINKENATLHYSNYFNRIEIILKKCQNDPILMNVILKSFHINIKLNVFLLSHPKYTHFGLLNIINNYEAINISSEEHDYNSEWQQIIFVTNHP